MSSFRDPVHSKENDATFFKKPLSVQEVAKLLEEPTKVTVAISRNNTAEIISGPGPRSSPVCVWLVFPDPSASIGHYITTILRPEQSIEIFDPYGSNGLGRIKAISLLPDEIRSMASSFSINKENFEGAPNPKINDCGSWAALRANHANLTKTAFYNRFSDINQIDIGEWAQNSIQHTENARETFENEREERAGAIQEQMETGGSDPEKGVMEDATVASDNLQGEQDIITKPTFSSFFANNL